MATAKIQYTIQLEDLPDEVKNRLSELASKADGIGSLLDSFVSREFNTIKLAADIEAIRQEIALLDANLADCYSILSGYAKYEAQQLQIQKQSQEIQEDEPTGGN
jgi:K+/H+ antiporter YhaU regulatory subunit KhtT